MNHYSLTQSFRFVGKELLWQLKKNDGILNFRRPPSSALLGVSSKDCFIFLVRLITNYVLKDISAVTSLPRLSRTMSAANSSDQKVRHLIPNAACCVKFWSRVSRALFDVQCHSARISPGLKMVLVLACKFGTWQTLCFRIETWVRSYSIIWSWIYLVPDAWAMFFVPVQYSKISRL